MSRGRALVLGGAGLAGVAWETGVLFGLTEAGIDVTGADLVVGWWSQPGVANRAGTSHRATARMPVERDVSGVHPGPHPAGVHLAR